MSSQSDTVNVKEAARYLGVSKKEVRAWLKSGELHGFKVGRAWRLPTTQLETFRGGQKVHARPVFSADDARTLWEQKRCPVCRLILEKGPNAAGWDEFLKCDCGFAAHERAYEDAVVEQARELFRKTLEALPEDC